MPTVVIQKWEESERGWGVRPDGWSMHTTEEVRAEYVSWFMAMQQELLGEAVPDEYSRPSGTPYVADVDDDTFAKLEANKMDTVRFHNNDYPGTQGTDGWRTLRGH